MPIKTLLWRWLPLLLWMAVIWFFSADPDPYRTVYTTVVSPQPTPQSTPAAKAIPRAIPPLLPWFKNYTLGEISHFLEYSLLGLLALRALRSLSWAGQRSPRLVALAALLVCQGYSLLDEIHQIFVPRRAFQLLDLVLDLLGSALGIALYWALTRLFRPRVTHL